MVLLVGCRRDVSAAEGSASHSEPASAAAVSAPAPAFDEAPFSLRLVTAGPYAVDKTGSFSVELKAKTPYHVNQEYPYKLKLKPVESVEFAKQTITRESMAVEQMSVTLKVPFKSSRAGVAKVEGEFAFSLCTADRCLIEKRVLATDLVVR